MNHSDSNHHAPYVRSSSDNRTVNQLLNDPNVVYNPYQQYGVKMSLWQKRKLKRQIRLQMQAKSWFQDKYQFVLVQRNILAVITIIALFSTLASVYAVKQLSPLKSVEPFIIQVEERSGMAVVVEPTSIQELKTGEESLDDYFLWYYVRSRETYHPADQTNNWNNTRVMSSPNVFNEYLNDISPNNPLSARTVLSNKGTRVLSTPTITYLNDPERKVAQIRFMVEETFQQVKTRYPKIATIEYDYFELELNRAERLVNPLGFQVISYRLDEEVVR